MSACKLDQRPKDTFYISKQVVKLNWFMGDFPKDGKNSTVCSSVLSISMT